MEGLQNSARRVISTEDMLKALVADSDNEHEYRHVLGGMLFSTHWFVYDSTKGKIGHLLLEKYHKVIKCFVVFTKSIRISKQTVEMPV